MFEMLNFLHIREGDLLLLESVFYWLFMFNMFTKHFTACIREKGEILRVLILK